MINSSIAIAKIEIKYVSRFCKKFFIIVSAWYVLVERKLALLHGELSSLGWHPNGLMNNRCPQGSGHEAVKE